jgi:phosphohistidine phosphatase
MGKDLLFIRHSEAREAYRGQSDIDRDLSDSGSVRAMQLANYLNSSGFRADALLSSEAVRARATAKLLAEKVLSADQEIIYHQDLYESSVRLMLALINQLDNQWEKVILVGHNPIIPYTAEYLSNSIVDTLEPGGVLWLKADTDNWAEISGKTMELKQSIGPSEYVQKT